MRFWVPRLMGAPRIRISPVSGAVMFMIIRIVVVLPAPLGPRSPNIAPRGTLRERSSTARNLPKAFETFDRTMALSMGMRIITKSLACGLGPNRLGFALPTARRGAGVVEQAGLENR